MSVPTIVIRRGRVLASITASIAIAAGSALSTAPMTQAAVGDITEFALTAGTSPMDVAVGPDGNLWVANSAASSVSKVAATGAVLATYAMTSANSGPRALAAGADGSMWVALQTANKIARVTMEGAVTEFAVPTANSQPFDIAAGPDGALWFTEFVGNKIGRITTTGEVTEYAIPTAGAGAFGITAGPTGSSRMYFTESLKSKVGFITSTGQVTESVSLTAASLPQSIAVVKGSVWFAEAGSGKLGRLVNDSTVSEIAMAADPVTVAPGPGDTLWSAIGLNSIVAMTSDGGVTGTYALANANSQPNGMVQGPDGNMWVALKNRNALARVATGILPTSSAAPAITPATGVVPGTALTASTGTWINAASYAYQWQRCSSSDANSCAAIGGAAASTYTATTDDDKKYVRVGVTGTNASGNGTPAYSALIAVGTATPAPAPSPQPNPQPTGSTVSVGNGVNAELVAPAKQKRATKKTYQVTFTSTAVQGSVNLRFSKGKKVKNVTGLNVAQGVASYSWKAPKKWPTGKTTVVATFVPLAGTSYTQGVMKDTVKIK